MSFFVLYSLGGVGLLLVALGIWIRFRNRDPKRSFESTFVEGAVQLGVTIGTMAIITAGVPVDSWSKVNWIVGVIIAMSLLCTGFSFGPAFEMHRQKKSGASEAQRVGTGFSPR